MEGTEVAPIVTSKDSMDFIKWLLSGAVLGLGGFLIYLFNQLQATKEKIQEVRDEVRDNKESIALNDAHDITTDGVIKKIEEFMKDLTKKVDRLLEK